MIEQLVESRQIRSSVDLYDLKLEDVKNMERMGEKFAQNLLDALDVPSENDLYRFYLPLVFHILALRPRNY